MHKWRLEAFSDGVIAIIITIMVLEFQVPEGHDLSSLLPLVPIFFSYVLSFVFVAIYWNNHHHFFQAVNRVDGRVLWANMFLLFWLSLIPFATSWMGESHFAKWPVVLYGIILLFLALCYQLMSITLLKIHEPWSPLARAAQATEKKGLISLVLYVLAIIIGVWISTLLAGIFYVIVAIMWLVPDKRIEKILAE